MALACHLLALCAGDSSVADTAALDALLSVLPHVCTHARMPALAALADALRALLPGAPPTPATCRPWLTRAWTILRATPATTEPRQYPGALALVCALHDLWFDAAVAGGSGCESHGSDIREDPALWALLLRALADPNDSLLRKRAGHVILMAVRPLGAQSRPLSAPPLFAWEPARAAELHESFRDVVTLSEMIDEKQIHIIRPAMPRLQRLHPHVGAPHARPRLPFSWLPALLSRLGVHSRANVRAMGLLAACQLRFPDAAAAETAFTAHPFLCRELLAALNGASLYAISPDAPDGAAPPLGAAVVAFYSHLLGALPPRVSAAAHRQLLAGTREYVHNEVPSAFVLRALAEAPPCPEAYDDTAAEHLCAILAAGRRSNELPLRSTLGLLTLRVLRRHVPPASVRSDSDSGDALSLLALGDVLAGCLAGETWLPGDGAWIATGRWLRVVVGGDAATSTALAAAVATYLDAGLEPTAALRAPEAATASLARLIALSLPAVATATTATEAVALSQTVPVTDAVGQCDHVAVAETSGNAGSGRRAAPALAAVDPHVTAAALAELAVADLVDAEAAKVLVSLRIALEGLHTRTHMPLPRRLRALDLLAALGRETRPAPSAVQLVRCPISSTAVTSPPAWLSSVAATAAESVAAYALRVFTGDVQDMVQHPALLAMTIDAVFALLSAAPLSRPGGAAARLEAAGLVAASGDEHDAAPLLRLACLACLPEYSAPLVVARASLSIVLPAAAPLTAVQNGAPLLWSQLRGLAEDLRWEACQRALFQLDGTRAAPLTAPHVQAILSSCLDAVERSGAQGTTVIGCATLAVRLAASGAVDANELAGLLDAVFVAAGAHVTNHSTVNVFM